MSVTIDLATLANALRLGDSPEVTTEIQRLLTFVTSEVERLSPDAPDYIHNQAVVAYVGYLFATPGSSAGAFRYSGAAMLINPYRPGTSTPSTGVPSGVPSGVDNAAVQRLIDTHAAMPTAHHAAGVGVGIGVDVGSTADILLDQLGFRTDVDLPDDREWVDTGINVPAGVHVILIDAGSITDDFHIVDWDLILTHGPVVAGTESTAGTFETFLVETAVNNAVRIAHNAANNILLANDGTEPFLLSGLRVERFLAPVAEGSTSIHTGVRFPATAVAMRLGWFPFIADAPVAANFTVEGDSDGVVIPTHPNPGPPFNPPYYKLAIWLADNPVIGSLNINRFFTRLMCSLFTPSLPHVQVDGVLGTAYSSPAGGNSVIDG